MCMYEYLCSEGVVMTVGTWFCYEHVCKFPVPVFYFTFNVVSTYSKVEHAGHNTWKVSNVL